MQSRNDSIQVVSCMKGKNLFCLLKLPSQAPVYIMAIVQIMVKKTLKPSSTSPIRMLDRVHPSVLFTYNAEEIPK